MPLRMVLFDYLASPDSPKRRSGKPKAPSRAKERSVISKTTTTKNPIVKKIKKSREGARAGKKNKAHHDTNLKSDFLSKDPMSKFILANPLMASETIAKKFGSSESTVRRRKMALGIKAAPPQFKLFKEKKDQKFKEKGLTKLLEESAEENAELRAHVEAIKKLQHHHSSFAIKPRMSEGKSEATAIAVATDWHIGATVHPEQVNFLNEFNIPIAKARISTFFERVVRLTNKERQDIQIDELVLFLGGDMIDGSLHLDTIMNNEVAEPMKQAVIAQECIESGLQFLKEHGNFKRITVVCTDGNHGRVTQKLHAASRKGNALEYFLYFNLAARHPDLNWVIADGLHVYVQVYHYTLRFMHGDSISYGGVNGPYTYLNRRIYEWDAARRADITIMGHLHRYTIGGRKFLINGSIIGHNEYGLSLGGEYQPPIQSFFLLDKKRGWTVTMPILLNDVKA